MYGINKFKIALVAFLGLFVFVVAAMYVNTKDKATDALNKNPQGQVDSVEPMNEKMQEQVRETDQFVPEDEEASSSRRIKTSERASGNSERMDEIYTQINSLSKRMDELQASPSSLSSSSSSIKCKLQGVYENGQVVPITSDAGLNDARANGEELVLLCKF